MTVRNPAACSVYSPVQFCNCGSTYKRVQHPFYQFAYPVCADDCGEAPASYVVRKWIDGHCQEFSYDIKGRRIKTLDDCNRLALEISADVNAGTFVKANYKRKPRMQQISDTISDLIRDQIYPRRKDLKITLDDKLYIQEFMEPFLGEVGVFAISQVHLKEFIRTFHLKGEDQARAERLFNVIKQEIRL